MGGCAGSGWMLMIVFTAGGLIFVSSLFRTGLIQAGSRYRFWVLYVTMAT